ncbi:MAG: YhbY family RNA-binding protein [Opitutales bacterium]|nr:YhbY family RNA-binding protein [Opitutales bacterium]
MHSDSSPQPQLSSAERKHLRGLAMRLKPLIFIGKSGLTDAVIAATHKAFEKTELLKLKILVDDRVQREALASELANAANAQVVGQVGKTAALYRKKAEP